MKIYSISQNNDPSTKNQNQVLSKMERIFIRNMERNLKN